MCRAVSKQVGTPDPKHKEIGMNNIETAEIASVLAECAAKLNELIERLEHGDGEELFPSSKKQLLEKGICLQCSVDKKKTKATQRGLCTKHYHESRRRVLRGDTTYRWLISQGLIAPKRIPGRKAEGSVLDRALQRHESK